MQKAVMRRFQLTEKLRLAPSGRNKLDGVSCRRAPGESSAALAWNSRAAAHGPGSQCRDSMARWPRTSPAMVSGLARVTSARCISQAPGSGPSVRQIIRERGY